MEPTAQTPIVIAHRGASGFRPEHTIEAYLLGIIQGADFIEPDLVPTRDGVLVARHENALAVVQLDEDGQTAFKDGRPIVTQETTNVADVPEFADRLTVKYIDGVPIGGWFVEDMTLAEVKQLRARERIPDIRPENAKFNDLFQVPTLSEVILLVKIVELATGRTIGIYPETKHPTYFATEGTFLDGTPINRSLGQMLIDTLVLNDFTHPDRIFIQSFEFENLVELHNSIMPAAGVDIPLVQLYGDITDCCLQPSSNFSRPYDMRYNAVHGKDLTAIYGSLVERVPGGITPETGYRDLVSRAVINDIAARYAKGIGPWKDCILLRRTLDEAVDGNGDGKAEIITQLTGRVHPLLARACQAGLVVHPYTLRAEENFLTLHPNGMPQSITGEVVQLLGLGVNGFFIDQPINGVAGRQLFREINGVNGAVEAHTPLGDDDYRRIMALFEAARQSELPGRLSDGR